MMDACFGNEVDSEDEPTVSMPVEALPVRNLGLVSPVEEIYPAHYDPPIGRFLRQYFAECRRRARELREHERIQYADALYHRCRRLGLRFWAHVKQNARARPWEEYEKSLYKYED